MKYASRLYLQPFEYLFPLESNRLATPLSNAEDMLASAKRIRLSRPKLFAVQCLPKHAKISLVEGFAFPFSSLMHRPVAQLVRALP